MGAFSWNVLFRNDSWYFIKNPYYLKNTKYLFWKSCSINNVKIENTQYNTLMRHSFTFRCSSQGTWGSIATWSRLSFATKHKKERLGYKFSRFYWSLCLDSWRCNMSKKQGLKISTYVFAGHLSGMYVYVLFLFSCKWSGLLQLCWIQPAFLEPRLVVVVKRLIHIYSSKLPGHH